MVKMPLPMRQAESARRSAVSGPALTANTATPTTITQTSSDRSVGKTRKSTGNGRRAASMATKCIDQMATASENAAHALGLADLHGKAQPHIDALDRHHDRKYDKPGFVRHRHRRNRFPFLRRHSSGRPI